MIRMRKIDKRGIYCGGSGEFLARSAPTKGKTKKRKRVPTITGKRMSKPKSKEVFP